MKNEEITQILGYCGLICNICEGMENDCKGCKDGGGDENCYQRLCCLDKKIDGCWQCDSSPCKKGYFIDEEWMGLCSGFICCIKKQGIKKFSSLVKKKLGNKIDYGKYRFKNQKEILYMLIK